MKLAIKVENLSKYYKLGVINNGALWKDLQSYFARRFKKEDPNRKIGHQTVYERDGFWALSDINLEIEQGDRVGIMGRNGAGKSTLLKILSRITAPTEGSFHIKGRIASLLEVGTGFHSELTGRENIFMNGAILGMKRKEVARKLDEIIAFSEIEAQHIDTPVKRYSSGMYVRLGFAIAAHLESEILISDEVLAVGDLKFREKAIERMNYLSKDLGRTVLFVSHMPHMIKRLCNKGFVLERGKMKIDMCPIDEAITSYTEMIGVAS
ncbi:MAG: ABC transporter ATP-binding protein [Leptospirales bacterium]|nr:ABC transporter ATP-binding protein [Leptospirales bacterium]